MISIETQTRSRLAASRYVWILSLYLLLHQYWKFSQQQHRFADAWVLARPRTSVYTSVFLSNSEFRKTNHENSRRQGRDEDILTSCSRIQDLTVSTTRALSTLFGSKTPHGVQEASTAEQGGNRRSRTAARVLMETSIHSTNIPDVADCVASLKRQGFGTVLFTTTTTTEQEKADVLPGLDFDLVVDYRWNPAVGMLQQVPQSSSASTEFSTFSSLRVAPPPTPRFVPVVADEEAILVQNGWSFLDVDGSEPLSPFDIDAANIEGQYIPKWGKGQTDADELFLSNLGFSLRSPFASGAEVLQAVNELFPDETSNTRRVLLYGATDPIKTKRTANNFDFSGSIIYDDDKPVGIFACALTGLPLFSTADLSPTTASSGWLTFRQPLSPDHVSLLKPDNADVDGRTEVVTANVKLHLGHYFGSDGYCINASALKFFPVIKSKYQPNSDDLFSTSWNELSSSQICLQIMGPVSYRLLERAADSPSLRILRQSLQEHVFTQQVVLGAGCFWHVETALRRLPGVMHTRAGYSGGTYPDPSYERVCQGDTGHAEVVMVRFDPRHLASGSLLFDCFLTMHDPTKVRAHGKHAAGKGQYRSCIFLSECETWLYEKAKESLHKCRLQLNKELSTELRTFSAQRGWMGNEQSNWFGEAEDRHQRHEERFADSALSTVFDNHLSTLALPLWPAKYGRRKETVLGSRQTLENCVTDSRFNS